jgi:HNH endonuclease
MRRGGTKNIPWSAAELVWVEAHRMLLRKDAHAMFCAKFREIKLGAYAALCKRKGWTTGRDGRIQKGNVPANKGKKMPFNANRARTQFKKGHQPRNTKFLGHERVSKDGYVEISIDQENPHTGFERRYVLKHKYLWERKNGPVPSGMCLKCLDGNRLNTAPSNWTLIQRALLPFMNGHRGPNYDSAAAEVKPAVLTLAKLKHARFAKARGSRSKAASA